MKKINWILLAISSLVLVSCEDFLTTTITIDIEEHEPRQVGYAYWNTAEDDHVISLYNSVGTLENNEPSAITDATLSLSLNGNTNTNPFTHLGDGFYGIDNVSFQAGDEVIIRSEVSGYQSILASQIVPSRCEVISATYAPDEIVGEFGEVLDEFDIEIENKTGKQYYALRILGYYNDGNFDRLSLESLDPNLYRGIRREMVFDDSAFGENPTGKVKILADDYNNPYDFFRIELTTITEARYRYARSYRAFDDSGGGENPFAEPVTVYTNFENGYGVFSISQSTDFDLPR